MTGRAFLLLLMLAALGACKQAIRVDTRAASSIPTEVAVSKLKELLPKAAFLSCNEPRATVAQTDIKAWTVDAKGFEFRTTRGESFRLAFSSIRGLELTKIPLSYELKVFAATPQDARKDLYRINWKEEAPARQSLELFEALREER